MLVAPLLLQSFPFNASICDLEISFVSFVAIEGSIGGFLSFVIRNVANPISMGLGYRG